MSADRLLRRFPSFSSLARLVLVLLVSAVVMGAKPLSKAERRVCGSLKACLSILDRHSTTQFDYDVLARELARFGAKGETALLQRIRGNDERVAGHAADLLALSGTPSTLQALDAHIAQRPPARETLLRRTRDAIANRLDGRGGEAAPANPTRPFNKGPVPCRFGEATDPAFKRNQMPFFETKMAGIDARGMIRPSATYPIALPRLSRAHLNGAIPVGIHWVGAYDGGLIYFDGQSGRPTVLSDQPAVSVQPWTHPDLAARSDNIWAILQDGDATIIMDASPPAPQIEATLPGSPAHLRRVANGDLIVSTTRNLTVRLRPDGSITNGCAAPS